MERHSEAVRRPSRQRGVLVMLLAGLLILPVAVALHDQVGGYPARALAAEPSAQEYVASGLCDIAGGPLEPDFAEQRMLETVNRYRAALGLPELAPSPTLQRAARWKALSLAALGPEVANGLNHDDPDGRTWDQRFLDCGYPASADFAENLAAGTERVVDVVDAWRQSPAHARNLRDGSMRYAGVARARAGSLEGTPLYVWVLDFGTEP